MIQCVSRKVCHNVSYVNIYQEYHGSIDSIGDMWYFTITSPAMCPRCRTSQVIREMQRMPGAGVDVCRAPGTPKSIAGLKMVSV